MIQVDKLGIAYGDRTLFEGVSMNLNEGCRYGITGSNGSGKSTFLKVLSGAISPHEGRVGIPAGVNVGFLEQDHFEYENVRIVDTVLMGRARLWAAIKEKNDIHEADLHDAKTGMRLAELEGVIGEENGYGAESEASIILEGLGIASAQHAEPMSTLSGGFKLRVLLAKCLFGEPRLLLLDEPTNHLDISSIAWLEGYLSDYDGVVVVVSHDHHFLNAVVTHILDIDYEGIKLYYGNYDKSLEAKGLERSQQEQRIAGQQKKKEELTAFYNRFKGQATKARQAVSRKKQADKMEEITIKRSSRVAPFFKFTQVRPSGRQVLDIKDLTKGFDGKTVIDSLSLSVMRGEKVAVIGPNGAGKTTLMKLICGDLKADGGEMNHGHEVSVGYFAQNHKEQIEEGSTPYKWLLNNSHDETIGSVRGTLGQMLFSGDDGDKNTAALSGGEGARLIFARLILGKNNFLLLDEPTNHLDIESVEALADALIRFPGTVVFVSHDRYFVERVATSVLEITPGAYDYYRGGYNDFLAMQEADATRAETSVALLRDVSTKSKKSSNEGEKKQDVRSLNKELSRAEAKAGKLEKSIKSLEEKIAEINEELGAGELYKAGREEELETRLAELKSAETKLEDTLAKWEKKLTRVSEIKVALA